MKVTQREFCHNDIVNLHAHDAITADIASDIAVSKDVYTILRGDLPVCIWGKFPVWEGRCIMWALMGEGSRKCMHNLIQLGRSTLATFTERRIEATVKVGFSAGVRFIEHCGFHREGVMHKFSIDGDHEYLYARIQ